MSYRYLANTRFRFTIGPRVATFFALTRCAPDQPRRCSFRKEYSIRRRIDRVCREIFPASRNPGFK